MVGTGRVIPDKDASDIGIPARRFLDSGDDTFVLLVDDLEASRANNARAVFDRYRLAVDTMLSERAYRASVHFLVPMLEAYYFADTSAVNAVPGTDLADHPGDVETIGHPKNELRAVRVGFDATRDGPAIVRALDVMHVLSRPDTCASLRTMVLWVCAAIGQTGRLLDGRLFDVTKAQLPALVHRRP